MKKHWIALWMVAASPASLAGGMEPPAIQGEAIPVARTENTVTAWTTYRVWMAKSWFARTEIRQILSVYAAGKLRELPVIPVSGGEVLYPLGHVLPILQTAPVAFSQVILGKGVRPVSLVGAPDSEWVTKTGFAAGHPVLEIMPLYVGLRSNVQITAESPHGHLLTYTIGLVSDKTAYTPTLAFYRQHFYHKPSAQEVAHLAAQDALNPIANASQVETDWRVSCYTGDCHRIRPLSVLSSATATFIKLPTETAPMVLVRNRAGASMLVHTRMDGHTLVVGAVPHRIDLITGTGKDIAMVRITKEGNS
ncbi:MAG: TrbG/VirB9 family P-type conjugative transfer protein [Acidithiobacillus sp.]